MPFIEKSAGHAIEGLQSGDQEGAGKTRKDKCDIPNVWVVIRNSSYHMNSELESAAGELWI